MPATSPYSQSSILRSNRPYSDSPLNYRLRTWGWISACATRKASTIESSGLSTSSNNTSAKYAAAHRPSATCQTIRTRLESAGIPACADGVPCSASLVQDSNLVINKDPLCLKIVVRAGDGDLRRGEVELCRAQLDDVAQPVIVASLSQIERGTGLLQQLLCQRHAIVSRGGTQPGDAHIPDHAILQVVDVLESGLSPQLGLRLPGLEQAAVEDRDRDVHADRAVTSRYRCIAGGHETGGTDHAKIRVIERVLRLGETLGCALLETPGACSWSACARILPPRSMR